MYCPKCGCEYQEGFIKCSDCNVDLISEKPTIGQVRTNLVRTRGKEKDKTSDGEKFSMAKITLICAIATILYVIFITVHDLLFLSIVDSKSNLMTINVLCGINFIGLTFGFISIAMKEKRKKRFYVGMVINSILPFAIVIGVLKAINIIF